MDTVLPDLPMTMASRYIRHLPGPARTVPIIALAGAHTNAEEDGWRAAGIDEVASNAPSLPALTDVIGRHVWLGATSEPTALAPSEWHAEGEDGIPLLSIDRIRELRANIPHEQLIDMVEECITDLNHRLPTLRRALNAKTHLAISAQAHAMVGMAGGYGMSVLEARLRAIMSAVREDRLDTIDGAADMVEADLTRATAALRQAVGSNLPAQ